MTRIYFLNQDLTISLICLKIIHLEKSPGSSMALYGQMTSNFLVSLLTAPFSPHNFTPLIYVPQTCQAHFNCRVFILAVLPGIFCHLIFTWPTPPHHSGLTLKVSCPCPKHYNLKKLSALLHSNTAPYLIAYTELLIAWNFLVSCQPSPLDCEFQEPALVSTVTLHSLAQFLI